METPLQEFIRLDFYDLQQIHDLQRPMRHPAGTGNNYFDLRQSESEIRMDQFPEAVLAVYPAQRVPARTKPICHNAVVSADHAGKKPKTKDALAVIMFQAFVIDQRDLSVQDRPKHSLIIRLLFFCMGEEKIGLPGQQVLDRYFLDAKQKITFAELVSDLHARRTIFFIRKTPVGRSLHQHPDFRYVLLYPFTLSGCQRHTIICRDLAFAQ